MDPDSFLRSFHAAHPGVTTRAFARGRGDDGRSSYDLLAERCAAADHADHEGHDATGDIVDIGCGDGYLLARVLARGVAPERLVGVDLSAEELAAARARLAPAPVRLRCESARATGLASGSAACVLSHLGFTLMSDLEAVVAEIARILRPGGRFATVVGGGPRGEDAFALLLDLARDAIRAQPARVPRLGDPRARRDDGLRALFGPHSGFAAELEIADFPLRLDGSIAAVWDHLATIYELFYLPESARQALRERFVAAAQPLVRPDGSVPCTAAMRLFACRRLR